MAVFRWAFAAVTDMNRPVIALRPMPCAFFVVEAFFLLLMIVVMNGPLPLDHVQGYRRRRGFVTDIDQPPGHQRTWKMVGPPTGAGTRDLGSLKACSVSGNDQDGKD